MMERRGSIVGGLIFIAVGLFFLLLQTFPNLANQLALERQWPLLVVGAGAVFFIGAVLGTPGLVMPGMIIGGTGLILYYQNLTDQWSTWAFAWTLYPGFAGLGLILMKVLSGGKEGSFQHGVRLMVISAALFLVFGVFFDGFGGFGRFWPLLLIVSGIWLLLQNRRRK